ncbi:major facilitator superfamily domain-containing protein [Absidia repens]|uniref:Major facilitator superfamily domain-containing protein n=1 Tax=Absidia repens TaxID=90262 RepID=A0A1X2ID89_9FUNG|nr:major facilitator superfamily domain-containing protein [Absidia repens]
MDISTTATTKTSPQPRSRNQDYTAARTTDTDDYLDTIDEVGSVSDDSKSKGKKKNSKAGSFFTMAFRALGLLSDGYQASIISFINLALGNIYGHNIFNTTVSSRLSYSLFVGCVFGQLGFGFFVDRFGRKPGLIGAALFVIIGGALSAGSYGTTPEGLLWMMTIARGILGIGIGAEFPCSSVSAGESADEISSKNRGMLFVLVTNFVIDLGYVLAALMPVILLAIFTENNLEPVWRLCLGIGIIPPLAVLYIRLKMTESDRYKKMAMKKKVPYLLIFKRYWKRLFAVSFTWFVYDFISYPSSLYSSVIINQVSEGQPMIITSAWNILLYSLYLPGCLTGAFLVDRIGRRQTLTLGLISLGVVGILLGITFDWLTKSCFPLFVVMYGIYLALAEMGPGNTIGLLSVESFSVSIRGTGYGIAAAFGKIGATVGTVAFGQMKETLGLRAPFLVGSCIAIVTGCFAWFAFQEIDSIDLEREDIAFKQYLRDNGYDVSLMGLDSHDQVGNYGATTVDQDAYKNDTH